jgi:hypothetical protein
MRCWGAVENDMPSLRLNTHTHGLDAISNMDLTPDGRVAEWKNLKLGYL